MCVKMIMNLVCFSIFLTSTVYWYKTLIFLFYSKIMISKLSGLNTPPPPIDSGKDWQEIKATTSKYTNIKPILQNR